MDTTTILCSLVLCLIVVWVFKIYFKNHDLPPGPIGLPILGYYFFLRSPHYVHLMELSKKYNSDIISISTVGGTPIIALHGLKTIKEVLVSRADEFIGRPLKKNIVGWVDECLGIAQAEGFAWKEQRRFFLQTVKDFGYGKIELESRIHDEIHDLLNEIKQLQGKAFCLSDYVTFTVTNIISHFLCIRSHSRKDKELQEFAFGFSNFTGIFINARAFLLGFFFDMLLEFTADGRKAKKAKIALHDFTKKIVDDHVRSFDPHHVRNFVDAYLLHMKNLKEKGELKDSSFSMDRLRAVVFNSYLDGIDSVRAALCNLLSLLSEHPEAQKKAQEELDNVVGKERLPSWLDKPKLPYVDALILELFRMRQPFFVSTMYSNFEETKIQGYRIPKRSVIVANLWSVNNDPNIFPQPSKFDPNRYLSSDGKRIKKDGPIHFGVGKRSCSGEALAQMEVFLIITALLQSFTLQAVSEDKIRAIPRKGAQGS